MALSPEESVLFEGSWGIKKFSETNYTTGSSFYEITKQEVINFSTQTNYTTGQVGSLHAPTHRGALESKLTKM